MPLGFKDFNKQKKKDWNRAAEKALKGKPIDDLKWKIDDHISLDPIYSYDEEIQSTTTLEHWKDNNEWWIAESFDGSRPAEANDLLLKALANGIDSPSFLDVKDFHTCLKNVRIDFIFPLFLNPSVVDDYISWINQQDVDKEKLSGGFILLDDSNEEWKLPEVLDHIRLLQNKLPQYYYALSFIENNEEDLAGSLALGVHRISDLVHQLLANQINPKIICQIECTDDFVKSIAKIRALKLMLAQICNAYQIHQNSILIEAIINQTAQDLQLSLIGATTKAMAAVTAGIDRMEIVCEAMNVRENEDVARRMVRNIHHVMKLESGLNHIVNPAAGSYAIERLTLSIAKSAWSQFQKL